MNYVVALSGLGEVRLYKTENKYLDNLLEKLECEDLIFMVVDNKYVKNDTLCLNVYEMYKRENIKEKIMDKQEMINILRDIADSMEENDYLCHSEDLRKVADKLQKEPNPIQDIVKLNKERYGLTFNSKKAYNKLNEELKEFKDGIKNNNEIEMLDALADIIVIATGEIRKMGYDPILVLNETVKEISSRKQDLTQVERWAKGEKEDGEKWLKDKSQDKSELYKADFEKCKI